ncbi:MAG: carbohydrate kinase family protein [Oscillospiraceae bacterium]|jgi:sugar/nucleoside kinase (ribokinase family)
MRICCLGDARTDIVIPYGAQLEFEAGRGKQAYVEMKTGGTSANCANLLGRLGADVMLAGPVYEGAEGEFLIKTMRKNGVDLSCVERSKQRFSIFAVVDSDGERHFMYWKDDDSFYPDFTDYDFSKIPLEGTVIVLSGANIGAECSEPMVAYAEECSSQGITVALDLNLRFFSDSIPEEYLELLRRAARCSKILFGSGTEEFGPVFGYDDLMEAGRILSKGRTVVLRRGRKAPLLAQDGAVKEIPFTAVKAVSTVGAGDAFDAGFLYGMTLGLSMEDCVRAGNAVSGWHISHEDRFSVPAREEIIQQIRKDSLLAGK